MYKTKAEAPKLNPEALFEIQTASPYSVVF